MDMEELKKDVEELKRGQEEMVRHGANPVQALKDIQRRKKK